MYGAFLCGPLNDMKNGIRFGKIALSMLERVEKTDKSLAIYMVHTFINHMTEPIYKSLDPLLNSYESGMQTGEIIGAVGSIVSYCETYVMAGLPLAPIEKDIRLYHQLLVEYEQKQALDMLLPMWQFVLNLLGKSEDPSKLTGEVMDQAKFIETQKRNKNSVIGGRARIYHLELTYLLCPIDYSANLLVRLVAFIKTSLLCPCYIRFRCLHGLIALAMARKTRNKKWFKLAKGATKQVKRWVEGKTGNILHLLLLMNAEYDSLSKSNEDVKRSFDLAISAAGRSGFVHDQALANERAGIFFLETNDEFWASFYLSRARDLYRDWGAQAKVDSMNGMYDSLLSSSEPKRGTAGHKGRSRFIDVSKIHKKLNFDNISLTTSRSTH